MTAPALRVVRRELVIAQRQWSAYIPFLFAQPLLYFGALGVGLGSVVDRNANDLGMPYAQFAAPGLLMGMTFMHAIGGSLWPITLGTTWNRTFHGIVATPIGAPPIFVGHVLWLGLRSLAGSAVYLLIAAAFGAVPSWWGVLAVPAAALVAMAAAAPTAAYAATQDSDHTYTVLMRLFAMPLFLASGSTFPISQLPSGLRIAAQFSPLYHGVELGRAATLGEWDASLVGHAAVLVGIGLVGWAIGRRTLTRRLTA